MRIIFIRHAESNNNVLGYISQEAYENQRSSDPTLSERGF